MAFSAPGAAEMWNRRLIPMGNLALGFLLPALLWIGKKLLAGTGQKGTSCREKSA